MTGSSPEPAPPPAAPDAVPGSDQSTVGTGSAVAIGCSVATLFLILVGIGLVVLLRLV